MGDDPGQVMQRMAAGKALFGRNSAQSRRWRDGWNDPKQRISILGQIKEVNLDTAPRESCSRSWQEILQSTKSQIAHLGRCGCLGRSMREGSFLLLRWGKNSL